MIRWLSCVLKIKDPKGNAKTYCLDITYSIKSSYLVNILKLTTEGIHCSIKSLKFLLGVK